MNRYLLDEEGIPVDNEIAIKVSLKASLILSHIRQLKEKGVRVFTVRQLPILIRMFSEQTIKRELEKLIKHGFIEKHKLTPEEKRTLFSSGINSNQNGVGDVSCVWCGCKTYSPHEHHFPISKSKGGKNIILVCPNCHYGYHSLRCEIKEVRQI